MTIDGFLTLLGFMVAGYAVLPPITRLRLGLHSARQIAFSSAIFAAIILLLFFDPIYRNIPSAYAERLDWLDADLHPDTVGPNKAAFLLVISWIIGSFVIFTTTRPNAIALPKLRVLIERLHDESRFLEIAEISKPYIKVIDAATHHNLPLQKTHFWLRNGGPFPETRAPILVLDGSEDRKPKSWLADHWQRFSDVARNLIGGGFRVLSGLVPSRSGATENASSIENLILKSPGVVDALVLARPDVALELMRMKTWTAEEFRTNLFQKMLSDQSSRFYFEINLLEFRNGDGSFLYINEAALLGPLIRDASLSSRLSIWKPIGEAAIRLIDIAPDYRSSLVSQCPGDEVLWRDSTYCTLHFFEMMISSGARQGVKSHMWLMYMSVFAEKLEKLHVDTSPAVDQTAEFPTLGCRLLYEITNILQIWIDLSKKLKSGNFHISPDQFTEFGSASIPWCAAKDYAEVIRTIIRSPFLPDRFKVDRWESYVRFIGDLPLHGPLSSLRKRLISEAILPSGYSRWGKMGNELAEIHQEIDPVVRYSCEDLELALSKIS